MKQKDKSAAVNRKERRKNAAVFPEDDGDVQQFIAESLLKQLKLAAEESFCFGLYNDAKLALGNIRDLEIRLYGVDSKEVMDTEFELMGIWRKLEGNLRSSVNEPGPKNGIKKQAPEVIFNKSPKRGYEPGPKCAKVLMANAILELEGRTFYSKAKTLMLLRQAFEARLERFGPDSLLMLLAQRLYYIEASSQSPRNSVLALEAKKELVRKLEALLGKSHRLCQDLELKLRIRDDPEPESDVSACETHTREELIDIIKSIVKSYLEEGRPELAHMYLEPQCTLPELHDTLGDDSNQSIFLLMAEVQQALRQPAEARVFLKKVYDQRCKDLGPNHVTVEEVQRLMDSTKANPIKYDEALLARARMLVEEAKEEGLGIAASLKIKFNLAQTLLDAFLYDQGFKLLIDVFLEQANSLGYKHADTVSTMDAICCHDLCREFLSFPSCKDLKNFFDTVCPLLDEKLSKTDKVALKARFFQAYINGVVEDKNVHVNRMDVIRDLYARIHGTQDDALFFQPKIKDKFESTGVLDGLMDQLDESPHRHELLACCDAALQSASSGCTRIIKSSLKTTRALYSKACKDLRPHDPIKAHILDVISLLLDTVWDTFERFERSDHMTFLKDASKKLDRQLGPKHPVSVRALVVISCTECSTRLGEQNIPDEAIQACENALERCVSVFGNRHEVTVKAKQALGGILSRFKGNQPKARSLLLDSTDTLKHILDPYKPHQIFINHCRKVGASFHMMGDVCSAIDHITVCANYLMQKYGPKHPETMVAQKYLKDLLKHMK